MKPNQVKTIQKRLLRWYDRHQRHLPWRRTHNPYYIWVSEVMLQQTQVKTVVDYYNRFIGRFPTIEHLAQADLEEVLKCWEGLGYYSRARNLHRAAGMVVTDYNAKVPEDVGQLKKLPGIGDYIAAAVASIAFEKPFAVVDGNVKRVLSRLFLVEAPVNRASVYPEYQSLAQGLLERQRPGSFNQAMMELGALVCKPRQPSCRQCPLKDACRAGRDGLTDQFPRRLAKKPVPLRPMVAAVILKQNRILITRRDPDQMLGGLWEFPGGTINAGEAAEQACRRTVREKVNLNVDITGHITRIRHAYTHFKITLDVFGCRWRAGRVTRNGPIDHRWIRPSELDRFPLHKAQHKFIPRLENYLATVQS